MNLHEACASSCLLLAAALNEKGSFLKGVIFLNCIPILSIEERLPAQAQGESPGQIGLVFVECGELSYLVLSMQKEINH